ncbi:MAG: hypothetical protein IT427_14590 [Pirellulales bacterium]|nr:hypothetical protein [Pirellulales bacterium]
METSANGGNNGPAITATPQAVAAIEADPLLAKTPGIDRPETTHSSHQSFWLWVMCLTGVDYFSTLGYQPSIAYEAAGILAPMATVVLVLITLFGALPVYAHVASQSPHGQGSIAMLEHLVHGWKGKALVLILLGFAATDFVITKTLSAADAAVHVVENPFWKLHTPPWLQSYNEPQQQLILTMFLLVLLGACFMRGFREVIGAAVVIVGFYLLLNAIVIGSGLVYLLTHSGKLEAWFEAVSAGGDAWHIRHIPFGIQGAGLGAIAAVSLLIFPKLALGLSGFETGVAVMPLIRGVAGDDPHHPAGRIHNTRKLLATAAIIMSVYLLGSALVTSTLIEPRQLLEIDGVKGSAADRALAYIAHGEAGNVNPLFGETFGTIYDIATVAILAFAGASAMAGLLNLVPQYLPRYGMAPEWARAVRPLVCLFTAINLLVTWAFNADVAAQGGAYATGVLVLITSACMATVIDLYRSSKRWGLFRVPYLYVLIGGVFLYTTVANIVERPDGIKIASFFILAIIASSFYSRLRRSTELRFRGFEYVNHESKFLWDSLKHLEFPVLVPHRPGTRDLEEKEQIIRRRHRLPSDVPIVFIEAELGDPSEFQHIPLMEIKDSEGKFIISVTRCVSIAHVIATIALELSSVGKPPEVHFGWSDENPMAASISFLLLGEGNVPWMVRELIRKAEPDRERRPKVFIG